MRWRSGSALWITALVGAVAFVAVRGGWASSEGDAAPVSAKPRDVSPLLAPPRAKHDLPGMAAAVVTTEGVVAVGATGVRRRGRETAVTVEDRWHIGSCTKAMTATLSGILVDAGTLHWDSTVGDAFRDLKVDPAWKPVTLEQLLTQTAGAPAELSANGLWSRLWRREGTPTEQRRALAEGVLGAAPVHPPGSRFLYANANYALAGAMAERAARKPWEDLIRERLFRPLGMTSAGFGAPAKPGADDQPWGHRADGDAVAPGPGDDNPPAIAPAGTVHCTIADLSKFAALHLRGAKSGDPLLRPATFRRLQAVPSDVDTRYAMGWVVTERPWGGGRVLTHDGSNAMWYCVEWLAPEKGFAVVVCCNQGGDAAAKGCDEAAWALIQDHQQRGKPAPAEK